MPFPADHFDIIYGHSVFTHLTYEDQFKWLAELRRVTQAWRVCIFDRMH